MGSAGQEQEPEEERGAAQLAHPEGDPTGSGFRRVAAMDADEDVEGDGERLPGEQEREGVRGDQDDDDRAEEEEVPGRGAVPSDTSLGRRPADQAGRDDDAEASHEREEQARQGIEPQRGLADAEG